jgi:hypothetical protein
MSKELEAQNGVKWIYTTLLGLLNEKQITKETYSKWVLTGLIPIENRLQALTRLEAHEKPVSSERVCKALSEYFINLNIHKKVKIYYYENIFEISFDGVVKVIASIGLGNVDISSILPPHLITLIGLFYENLEDNNES